MSPRLVLVTDPAFGDAVVERCVRVAGRALPRGWLCVQLRDKARPRVSLRVFAWSLRRITREVGAHLVINGDVEVARDVGADGVHLGGDALARGASVHRARTMCGAGAWVSMAAHSEGDVRSAIDAGADAVLVSPIFSSRPPSRSGSARASLAGDAGEPLAQGSKYGRGLDALRVARAIASGGGAARAAVAVAGAAAVTKEPAIIALGGVTPERARSCVRAGASGVAVMRALLASAEPGRTARAFHDAVAAGC